LVTDVVMPGMTGRQLAEAVARLRPGLRALFLSGYTPDEVLRQGVRAEEAHFLQKPFTPSALLGKVREVLTRSETASRQLSGSRCGI
jgi:two-component system, cell cycle sensor histidine kinase and response regulator CckA